MWKNRYTGLSIGNDSYFFETPSFIFALYSKLQKRKNNAKIGINFRGFRGGGRNVKILRFFDNKQRFITPTTSHRNDFKI